MGDEWGLMRGNHKGLPVPLFFHSFANGLTTFAEALVVKKGQVNSAPAVPPLKLQRHAEKAGVHVFVNKTAGFRYIRTKNNVPAELKKEV